MFTKKTIVALFIAAMMSITVAAQKDNTPEWTGPTGSWEGVVTNDVGPPPFRVLMNFTADGGFTGSGDGDSIARRHTGNAQYQRRNGHNGIDAVYAG